jgi:uncharacterized protein with NAD-binding domain and iron-sulfur cluster
MISVPVILALWGSDRQVYGALWIDSLTKTASFSFSKEISQTVARCLTSSSGLGIHAKLHTQSIKDKNECAQQHEFLVVKFYNRLQEGLARRERERERERERVCVCVCMPACGG